MTDHKKFNSTAKSQYKSRKSLSMIGNELPVPKNESIKRERFELDKQDIIADASINPISDSEIQISRCFRLEIDKTSGKSKINILNNSNNELIREIDHIYFLDLVYKLHN